MGWGKKGRKKEETEKTPNKSKNVQNDEKILVDVCVCGDDQKSFVFCNLQQTRSAHSTRQPRASSRCSARAATRFD